MNLETFEDEDKSYIPVIWLMHWANQHKDFLMNVSAKTILEKWKKENDMQPNGYGRSHHRQGL